VCDVSCLTAVASFHVFGVDIVGAGEVNDTQKKWQESISNFLIGKDGVYVWWND